MCERAALSSRPSLAGEVSKDGWCKPSRSGSNRNGCIRRHGLPGKAKDWLGRGPAGISGIRPRAPQSANFPEPDPHTAVFTRNTLQGSALIPTDQRTSSWLPASVQSSIRQLPTNSSAWKTCRFAKRANGPCNLPGARRIRSSATAMGCSCSNVGHVADRTAEARTPTVSRIMAAFC
jgi:hypothetical protein